MPFLPAATLWLLVALTSLAPAHGLAAVAPAQKPASFAPAPKPPLDWLAIRAESLRHFRALVQIDTSNPPGNEIKAVEYLQKVLAAEGIPSKTLALDPNRPNLVARLKGNGTKRPLLLLAHTDVVGVQRDKWPVDPFGAVLRDGYIWGRGTTDDKDNLTANLMAFLLVKRSGAPLERDLIFWPSPARRPTRRAWVSVSWSNITSTRLTRNSRWAKAGCHNRGRTRAPRADCHHREAAQAGAVGRHGDVRPRLDSTTGQRGDASRERGAEDWHVEHADAAQRNHAAVLREARCHQHARARRALSQPRQRPGRRGGRALSRRTRTRAQCHPAHVARADDAPGRLRTEHHSLDGRGGHRHSSAAGRRRAASDGRDLKSHRRSGGHRSAAAGDAPGSQTVAGRFSAVPRPWSKRRQRSTPARPSCRA